MLYQIYEAQRSLMEPFADFAQAAAKMYGSGASPLGKNPFSQRMSAGYDLLYRLGKDYEKPQFDIKTVDADGVDIVIHERVEIDKPFCELRRFKRFSDNAATLDMLSGQPAVLIVAPLSGHYATLLRDTVRTMLKDHTVYITDGKNARTVPLADGEAARADFLVRFAKSQVALAARLAAAGVRHVVWHLDEALEAPLQRLFPARSGRSGSAPP